MNWLMILGTGYFLKTRADKAKAEKAAAQLEKMPEQAVATGLRQKAGMVAEQGFALEARGRDAEAIAAYQEADALLNEADGIEHLLSNGNGMAGWRR